MSLKKIKLGVDVSKLGGANVSFNRTVHTLSGTEKTEIAVNGIQSLIAIIDGITELSKEREITKRKGLEHEEEMKRLDNDLEAILSDERVKLEIIKSEFELNYKQLENESESNRLQARIIEKILDRIDNLSDKFSVYEQAYGVDNPQVIRIDDKLHELSMSLTNQLRLQR
jgi:Skp family chaperone for outer membrane proteins